MDSSAQSWVKVVLSGGVLALFGRAVEGAFRWLVRRPLQREERKRDRAEREADYWRQKYLEVATELKANTAALLRAKRAAELEAGAPPESLPPPRDELPTLQCFVEGPPARAWAEKRERVAHGRSVRVIETYAPNARPADSAPTGFYPDAPISLAPPFPPPNDPPRGPPRPRRR